jgi:transketolase
VRKAFIEELVIAARNNPNIFLIVGDLGFGVIEPFAEEFPDRFINSGVAEQSMMSIAAGLASEGFHPFVYSIANFPTFRCAEQIRNDIAYHNLPVTIVAVGGGLTYGNLGYSHHAVQDYALLRSMPGMLIGSPGDPFEVRACIRYLIDNPQPSYLRLSKSGEPVLHSEIPKVLPGQWLTVRKGTLDQRAYLTTGGVLNWVMNEVSKESSVYSLPLWGMMFKHSQPEFVSAYSSVVTVEDHLLDGGMGSWMLESLATQPDLIRRIRIEALNPSICGMVGRQATLNLAGGLTSKNLCA